MKFNMSKQFISVDEAFEEFVLFEEAGEFVVLSVPLTPRGGVDVDADVDVDIDVGGTL